MALDSETDYFRILLPRFVYKTWHVLRAQQGTGRRWMKNKRGVSIESVAALVLMYLLFN